MPDFALERLFRKLVKPGSGFKAASPEETVVFGARRPGFPFHTVSQTLVDQWITFMSEQGIKRVVCLLPPKQLLYYDELLSSYTKVWGAARVCWTPIKDFHLADKTTLIGQILPFLAEAERKSEKTVVHCSGGRGRTGHVLAAWLVSFRSMSNQAAIETVKRSGRNAREARDKGLTTLLDACRQAFNLA